MSHPTPDKQPDVTCWVIIPAAGIGRRMQSDIPKQYLPLAGQTVLAHSLQRMSLHPAVREIILVLSADDHYWPEQSIDEVRCPVTTVIGGKERCDSVLSGLMALADRAGENDWILVHDAARPCIRPGDIQQLINACRNDEVGGLLAMPVRDTMKQANDDARVAATLSRDHLWHALTPQMFRYRDLLNALQQARDAGHVVTDEAMAMEYLGKAARLVEGHGDNIKITRPQDLALAAFYLQAQAEQGLIEYDLELEDGG